MTVSQSTPVTHTVSLNRVPCQLHLQWEKLPFIKHFHVSDIVCGMHSPHVTTINLIQSHLLQFLKYSKKEVFTLCTPCQPSCLPCGTPRAERGCLDALGAPHPILTEQPSSAFHHSPAPRWTFSTMTADSAGSGAMWVC